MTPSKVRLIVRAVSLVATAVTTIVTSIPAGAVPAILAAVEGCLQVFVKDGITDLCPDCDVVEDEA